MEEQYPKPSVTVDIVIFTIKDNELRVLLVKRDIEPFKNKWAIPGGFVRIDESLEQAAKRELQEETGLRDVYLEQLYSFGDPKRDPRGRVITVTYMALVNSDNLEIKASTDVSEARWFPAKKLPSLAFDHAHIFQYALKRLRWKFEYTTVAFSLLPKKFTISQVQKLYEIAFDKEFDKRNFAKKILSLDILKAEGINRDVSHRPPMLYSLKADIGKIVEII
ncbi:MAG: NUDIX domain-containing protein [Nanoarchaeota archaeon]|nr:NUDIX domain-containing protein [Nanoarchaeota archaeon]